MEGIFALRCPNRPNRIGTCNGKLSEVGNNKLTMTGWDAIDGTPAIDIKPYIPKSDSISDVIVSS